MKRFLWLGILFLSASWLFFVPQFTIPDFFIGTVFVIIGILCMIGGIWRSVIIPVDITYGFLLIPLIPALILIQFPYNLGLLVLTIGLLLHVLVYKQKNIRVIPLGIAFSGVVLLIQTIVFPLYITFISHGHRIDLFSPVVSPLANLLGMHTTSNNGLLFLQTIQQNYPVTITWEKLGCSLSFNLFMGSLLLLVFLYEKRKFLKYTVIFLIATFLYIILRFVGMLSLYVSIMDLAIFWNPLYMTLSFLPLALLLIKLIPLKDSAEQALQVPPLSVSKKHLFALFMMFLLVFSFVG